MLGLFDLCSRGLLRRLAGAAAADGQDASAVFFLPRSDFEMYAVDFADP